MKEDFPEYYRLKYDLSTASLEYVQDSLLARDQSLIEYFLGDSSLFIFLIQPDHYEVKEISIDSSFQQHIQAMTQDGIYGNYALPKSRRSSRRLARTTQTYAKAAHQLYLRLIDPIREKLKKDAKVIIVPDGAPGLCPFRCFAVKTRFQAL